MEENKSKIKLASLVLLIFSSIFGFNNSINAYYQMGYYSIIWYLVSALLFFLPSAMIFAEYGSTFKGAKGGIYSWLKGSVSDQTAFVGTFIWLAAWVIWLVSSTQFFFVSVSTLIFGHDTTTSWHLGGLSSTQTLGIMEIVFMVIVTFFAVKGVDKISFISNIGGIFTLAIAIGFPVLSLLVFFLNHGQLAQPLNVTTLTHSPNPAFQTPVATISFMIYALFAYGGLETSAGVIDSVDKPEKTFPRALIIAMVVMTTLYALNILMCGVSANWASKLGAKGVNLGNVEYVLINNLGYVLGQKIGLSAAGCQTLSSVISHFAGLADVLSGIAAAILMVYSPIKSFVMGCDPDFLPKKMTQLNKHGMPEKAMWVQALIVSVIIFFISFGGSAAGEFYTILMDMMNVSSTAPYLFLIGAFPFFKKKEGLNRPFVFFKSNKTATVVSLVTWIVVAIGIIFTCIEPLFTGDIKTAFWTAIGPVLFGIVALVYFQWKTKQSLADDGVVEE